ncbi:MAG TPA: hypothetical protein PKY59_18575 [Pyrinomonadaceae bacterium]|nr:hypothetical protein [Pyrinomonadaceae bacterium]
MERIIGAQASLPASSVRAKQERSLDVTNFKVGIADRRAVFRKASNGDAGRDACAPINEILRSRDRFTD